MTSRQVTRKSWFAIGGAMVLLAMMTCLDVRPAPAENGTEFPAVVLTVDQTSGRFSAKKDGGGTRFVFTANEKTKFSGTGLSSIKDLKRNDQIVVVYKVQGPQYLAVSITKK